MSSAVVLIDAGSFNYYRVTATMAWYRHQKGAPPMSMTNTDFLGRLESQALSCLEKFTRALRKQYGLQIPLNQMYFIRDCPRQTIWRHQYYQGYKGNRDDREAKEQAKLAGLSGEALDVAQGKQPGQYIKYLHGKLGPLFKEVLQVPGAEADDCLAVLTKFFLEVGYEHVFLVSLDSDYHQLLDPHFSATPRHSHAQVHLFSPKSWTEASPDPTALHRKILAGDTSDCITKISFAPIPGQIKRYWDHYALNSLMINFNFIPSELQEEIVHQLVHQKPLSWKHDHDHKAPPSVYAEKMNEHLPRSDAIIAFYQGLLTQAKLQYLQDKRRVQIANPPVLTPLDLEDGTLQANLFEIGVKLRSLRFTLDFPSTNPTSNTVTLELLRLGSPLARPIHSSPIYKLIPDPRPHYTCAVVEQHAADPVSLGNWNPQGESLGRLPSIFGEGESLGRLPSIKNDLIIDNPTTKDLIKDDLITEDLITEDPSPKFLLSLDQEISG